MINYMKRKLKLKNLDILKILIKKIILKNLVFIIFIVYLNNLIKNNNF